MSSVAAPDWNGVRELLCIRLDSLGDVLMCTPAMRALRQSLAKCRITLLSSAEGAAAARHVPEADAAIEYAAPWMKSSGNREPAHHLAMVDALSERGFDAAVIFTSYSQSALPAAMMCQLAGIALRLAHCRENPYQLLTHWVRDPEPELRIRHEVRRQLDLVAQVGCGTGDERLSFAVRDDDIAWMRHRLLAAGIGPARPWMLLHPGASAASRRYPAPLWSRAAAELAARTDAPVIFTGSANEAALVEEIRNAIPAPWRSQCFSLAGELDLGRLGAAIRLASVVVSNNTGPAHIAAAVGTPVVDLYALTNPQHTPWQVASRVLYHPVPCRNCYRSICPEGHHDCLARVEPAHVADAALELLQTAGASRFADRADHVSHDATN